MKYYDVNGIRFSFQYTFHNYFQDNIEKYEVPVCKVHHHIETIVVDKVMTPIKEPDYIINNRQVFLSKRSETIVVYKEDIPVILIEKANNYKLIYLYLLRDMEGIEEIEYIYTGIIFMEVCLYHGMQSIHGSAIQYQSQAIIFSGPSGIGKSTHVEYWKSKDPNIQIINDDKPLLSFENGTVFVSGSPWSGKTKINQNRSLPLRTIVFLEQGTSNHVEKLESSDKLQYLMRNINRPRQDVLWEKVKGIIEFLLSDIPMYKATVTNSEESVNVVKIAIEV